MNESDQHTYLEKLDFARAEVAEFYDELPLWSAPFGLMILERVPMRRGLNIVDVGSGTGFLSIELAQRCGGSTVYAVDPWKAAVNRLRAKIDYLKLDNVRVLEQDAATLELADESIDIVVSNLGINNFENADAVLQTCHRVLKRRSALFLTSNLVGHMHEFYDVYRQTLVDLNLEQFLPKLDDHIHHRATVESIRERVERAGFDVVFVNQSSFRMRFADGSSMLRHYFIRLGFVQEWANVVAPENAQNVFSALEKDLNEYARDRGELSLTIPIACIEGVKI